MASEESQASSRQRGFPLELWRFLPACCSYRPSGFTLVNKRAYSEKYAWGPFGDFGLRLDGLSLPFAVIIYILCTVIALYSRPYMVHKVMEDLPGHGGSGSSGVGGGAGEGGMGVHGSNHSSQGSHSLSGTNIDSGSQTTVLDTRQYVNNQTGLYFALYLAFSMGMLGTVLATNLIEFYVFFEIMLVPSFFLIAFYGYGARRRIALMFFFWTHVGAVVLASRHFGDGILCRRI